uniref:Serine protease K12H4.7 n=1 Tax=Anisakis simplex TaxID=6269 RepID=A0A0M3J9A1_ANISI
LGVVFVMIGGESIIPVKWVANENVSMMKWARKFGAAAFQVEHRFFGHSRPFPEMTTEALAYCTTEQALADLAEFIRQMNEKYKFPSPKWVTFGGSYPGSLAAWFRAKYPELTVGSVASSAPVNLKLDFYGQFKRLNFEFFKVSLD